MLNALFVEIEENNAVLMLHVKMMTWRFMFITRPCNDLPLGEFQKENIEENSDKMMLQGGDFTCMLIMLPQVTYGCKIVKENKNK